MHAATMDDEERSIENEDPGPPPESRKLHRVDPRQPPKDLDAEAALLGSLLLRSDITWEKAAGLTESDFAWPSYMLVFSAMKALVAENTAIHVVTVADQLRRMGVLDDVKGHTPEGLSRPGHLTLLHLQTECPGSYHAGDYVEVIARCSRARQGLVATHKMREAFLAGDFDSAKPAIDAAGRAVLAAGPGQAGLEFEDVGSVVRGEVADITPTMLRRNDGQCLMYPGLTHWLMAEPASGKTMVALYAVAQVLVDGGATMYLDWEGNRRIIGSRLRALGVTDSMVDERFLYARPSRIGPVEALQLVKVAKERQVALAVFDGVAKAMARAGLNEDKAPEVLEWLETGPNPLAEQAGVSVLMLDHVVKDRDGRGLWARGSGAKLGEVTGAAWAIRVKQKFSRKRGGRVDLVQAKDREGFIGLDGDVVASITFAPEDDGAKLGIEAMAPMATADAPFRPTGFMERISRLLEIAPEPLSVNKIRQNVNGKNDFKDKALGLLVDEAYVERVPKGDKRNTLVHKSVKPYREADDPKVGTVMAPEEEAAPANEGPPDFSDEALFGDDYGPQPAAETEEEPF